MTTMSESETSMPRRPAVPQMRPKPAFLTVLALLVAILAMAAPGQAQQGEHVAATSASSVLDDRALLERLTQGAMRKFKFADNLQTLPGIDVSDRAGARTSLAPWAGRMVLLNIWASWCTPCRQEMPALARLRDRLVPIGIDIVTLSIDKMPADALAFLRELGLDDLPVLLDSKMAAIKALGAQGAPTSILIDEAGRELGRIEGAVDWESTDALLLLKAVKLKAAAGTAVPAAVGTQPEPGR